MTISCWRLDYARLCVELDAGLPFIHHFEMDSPLLGEPLRVNVEYEWKPSSCESCRTFGHNCAKKEEVSKKGKQKEDERGQGNQQAPVSSGEVTVPLNNDVSPKSEPRICPTNMAAMEVGLGLSNWNFILNVHLGPLCRILMGWNTTRAEVNMVHTATQWITCDALSLGDGSTVRITYVYGLNTPASRCILWDYLVEQKKKDTIFKRLDWVFGNQSLLLKWPLMRAMVQARTESDHSPILVSLTPPPPHRKARFKFLNTWVGQEGYDEVVRAAWHTEAYGNPMSRLTTRLRTLKGLFTSFHRRHFSHITSRVRKANEQWEKAQVVLDNRPNDMEANTRE
ncbi:hypothetical protein OIU84_008506 [Salix udensis]|uniref:Uncharacterized protein n=1 Tax=Salix udensis TaxID=889485 RepID=A0AAD6NXL8_9ROSI|nr:hypothetical protein OIU84_008506 [Salix udensis]